MPTHMETGKRFELISPRQQCRNGFGDIRQISPLIDELFTHTLVGFDNLTPFILQALKQYPQLNRDLFTVRTDSDIAQLSLIRAGAGIGMCQVQLADFSPPLQRIMPDYFAFHLDTWLVMHEDLRHSQACKTVFDFLAEGLQAYINRAKR